jgi:hypothetical protein
MVWRVIDDRPPRVLVSAIFPLQFVGVGALDNPPTQRTLSNQAKTRTNPLLKIGSGSFYEIIFPL